MWPRGLSAILGGMTPVSLMLATFIAREATRNQFVIRVRAR
jgi:hypothetical protein